MALNGITFACDTTNEEAKGACVLSLKYPGGSTLSLYFDKETVICYKSRGEKIRECRYMVYVLRAVFSDDFNHSYIKFNKVKFSTREDSFLTNDPDAIAKHMVEAFMSYISYVHDQKT